MSLRRIGDATVTRVEEMLRPGFAPEQLLPDWQPDMLERHRHWMVPNYFDAAEGKFISSIHSWLIRTPHHTILLDACGGNHKDRPHFPRFHMLDTPYLDRLRAAGAQPEEVDIVLCTHLHIDHVGWNTRLENGRWVPTFPKARYLMSRIEHSFWNPEAPGEHSAEDSAVYQDSVLPVVAAGQAQLLDGVHEIENGLLIEPAPGHTPGHVTLRLASRGAEALFTGDIMHQPVQVYEPQLNSCFCEDPAQAERTRRRVLDHCVEHRALLMPAHFGTPHAGHIRRHGKAYAIDFDSK